MAAGLVKSVEKALDEETDMGRKKSGQGTVVVVGEDRREDQPVVGEVEGGRIAPAVTGEATLRIESLADVAAAGVPAGPDAWEQLGNARVEIFNLNAENRRLRDLLAAAEADISACVKRQHHVPNKALLEQIRTKLAESGA